jgi:1,4-dihydroxy-2-naphthoate octaprenyltransferase
MENGPSRPSLAGRPRPTSCWGWSRGPTWRSLVGVERGLLPWPVLATLLTLPLAVKQIRLVYREREPLKLNEAWTMGVQLLTGFGVLLVLGLLAGAWLG